MPETNGNMISRAIPTLPSDPKKLAVVLQKILSEHYGDINTLFAQTTDNDLIDQHRRENDL
jgi:hypothetical protein